MRKKGILVAADESSIALSIKSRLETDGQFKVNIVRDGAAALRSLSATVPDALVLDTSLRGVPAADICRTIRDRERTARLPVILLDGVPGLGLVRGLGLGADDYVSKPFRPEEFEARLKAVLRRHVHDERDTPDRFVGTLITADFAD